MITGVFGLPRSGKTTFLAYIADKTNNGKRVRVGHFPRTTLITPFAPYQAVFSTFPLKGCYKLEWETVGAFQYENCLMLIDEISHYCDNRDWKNFTPELRYFFTMHGHMKNDIVYCSQFYTDVDKKIQNMTEQLLYVQRLSFNRSLVSPVYVGVTNTHTAISPTYDFAPRWGCTAFNRKKYYSHFDSFDFKRLPPVPAVRW